MRLADACTEDDAAALAEGWLSVGPGPVGFCAWRKPLRIAACMYASSASDLHKSVPLMSGSIPPAAAITL